MIVSAANRSRLFRGKDRGRHGGLVASFGFKIGPTDKHPTSNFIVPHTNDLL